MDLINNQDKLLFDDLKAEIKKGSKLKIAASYFSMYAYDALKSQLKDIEELQFIFSSPVFEKSVTDNIKKEKREFYLPNEKREDSIYGTEFEVRLKNKLTQKAIAKECANWIKAKVKFKSNKYGSIPNFIGIENENQIITYMPVEGFTTNHLGIEKGDSIFTFIQKNDDYNQTKLILSKFNELWKDSSRVDDITENLIDFLSNAYVDNSPEFIYFYILYNIFNEFLNDIEEDYIPNEQTGFKDSIVWNKLYNFQRDAVIGIINKLEKYNGCILADSVGLGKTFTALAVMKYYTLKNRSILVLCPKKLSTNWNSYKGNVKTNIFFKDKIRYDVLYHTDLGRKKGFSNGIDLEMINWENYDLIVIDESHNFRNSYTYRDKETRYNFLLNNVIKPGIKTKVLMLSATPVNNRFKDLRNQLALAYGDDVEEFQNKLNIKTSINQIFNNAQKAFNAWSNLPIEERNAKKLIDSLGIDFSILLDNVTIARSRKHITKFYDTLEIGKFPQRKTPKSYYCNLSDRMDIIHYNQIYRMILSMTMGYYAPTNYILASKITKYSEIYDITTSSGSTLKQSSREKNLQRLMSILLLKRLESCVESFRITLKNILEKHEDMLNKVESHLKGNKMSIDVNIREYSEEDEEELDDDFIRPSTTSGKVKIDFDDMDILGYKRDIEEDITLLKQLLYEMEKVDIQSDDKLNTLKEIIDDKIINPINYGNKKILIFSAYSDTVRYLYNNLSKYVKEKYNLESAMVMGGSENQSTVGERDMDKILTMFSPISREKHLTMADNHNTIDLLIATDCISEGQNLQDCDICINYDIHWNPVRIVQRFGRIDRIGSKNDYVQLVNFWPNISLDEYINLNNRVLSRMTIVDATATGDDNILTQEQIELDYRKDQLKKLQNGELQDLEDVDGTVTITDLGLNEFRMDLVSYIKQNGRPDRVPKGLHAVTAKREDGTFPEGVIFVLKNNNRGVDINRQNRLHPYFIVYISNSGEIVYNHLEVKHTLDALRSMCKGKSQPIKILCDEFNKETKDGFNMAFYNKLLEKAILSIIDVKAEKDIDSLFSAGGTIALMDDVKGLNDFELVSFIVVK